MLMGNGAMEPIWTNQKKQVKCSNYDEGNGCCDTDGDDRDVIDTRQIDNR